MFKLAEWHVKILSPFDLLEIEEGLAFLSRIQISLQKRVLMLNFDSLI